MSVWCSRIYEAKHAPVIDDVDRNYGEALFKLRQPLGWATSTLSTLYILIESFESWFKS